MAKKLTVSVTKTVQPAIPEIEKKEQTLYYLIIGEGPERVVINVGLKTYENISKITK